MGLMTYVGAEMGKGNWKNAQKYSIAGIFIFFIMAGIIIGLLFGLREIWAEFYSTNDDTKDALLKSLPWFIFGCLIFDGF